MNYEERFGLKLEWSFSHCQFGPINCDQNTVNNVNKVLGFLTVLFVPIKINVFNEQI